MFLGKFIKPKGTIISNIIEFEEHSIRLIQYSESNGKKNILGIFEEKVDPELNEDLSVKVSKLISRADSKVQDAGIIIPRSLIAVKYFTFPSIDPEELMEMVNLQLIKDMPISQNDIKSDYTVISQNGSNSFVEVFAVQRSVTDQFCSILKENDVQPKFCTVSSYALFSLIKHFYTEKLEDKKIIGLIYKSVHNIDFLIFNSRELLFSRSFSYENQLMNTDVTLKFISDSIAYFKKKITNNNFDKIFILNELNKDDEMHNSIRFQLNIPIDELNIKELASHFVQTGNKVLEFDAKTAKFAGLLLTEDIHLDFLKRESRARKVSLSVKKEIIKFIVLCSSSLILILLIIFSWFWKQNRYLNALESKINLTQPLSDRLNSMRSKSSIINKYLNRNNSSIEVLAEIFHMIPKSVNLSGFMYNSENELTLQGTSANMSDVFKLVSILEKSKQFEKVELRYASKRELTAKTITDFQIFCHFVPNES
ncbi:MAG: PilN domain-containing protein [bacterium]